MSVLDNRRELFSSVSQFVDEKSDTSMFNVLKQNKDLFYSVKYYKFQWEELMVQHDHLICEVKLMERLLNGKKEKEEGEGEKLHVQYESIFEEMKQEIQDLKDEMSTKVEEVTALRESEENLIFEMKKKDLVIENKPSEKLLVLSRAESKKLKEKLQENKEEMEMMTSKLKESELWKDTIVKLQNEVSALEKEIAEEKLQSGFNVGEVKAMNEEMVGLKADIQLKQNVIEEQVEELKYLKNRLEDKSNMVKFLYEKVKQVDEIILERSAWKIKQHKFQMEYKNLQQKFYELSKEKKILEKKLKIRKKQQSNVDEIKQREDKIKMLRDQMSELKARLEKQEYLKSKNKKLKTKNSDLTKMVDRLQDKLTERKRMEKEGRSKHDKERRKLCEELRQEKNKNAALQAEVAALKQVDRNVSSKKKSYLEEPHESEEEYANDSFEDISESEQDEKNSYFEDFISEEEGEEWEESIAENLSESFEDPRVVVDDSNNSRNAKAGSENDASIKKNEEEIFDFIYHTGGSEVQGENNASEEEGEACEESIAEIESENSGLFFGDSGGYNNFSLPHYTEVKSENPVREEKVADADVKENARCEEADIIPKPEQEECETEKQFQTVKKICNGDKAVDTPFAHDVIPKKNSWKRKNNSAIKNISNVVSAADIFQPLKQQKKKQKKRGKKESSSTLDNLSLADAPALVGNSGNLISHDPSSSAGLTSLTGAPTLLTQKFGPKAEEKRKNKSTKVTVPGHGLLSAAAKI